MLCKPLYWEFILLTCSLLVGLSLGQTTLNCAGSGLCSGGDISIYDAVTCTSTSQLAVCGGTHTWTTSSKTSFTYQCASQTPTDALACDGLHLKINSGSTATAITINCVGTQACRNSIFEINGVASSLTMTCGISVRAPCQNTTIISNGNINVGCGSNGIQSAPACEGITIRNTGASDKTLDLLCVGYWACANNSLSQPITVGHTNGRATIECVSPADVGKPTCSGQFVFEQSALPGTLLCDRRSSTLAVSMCDKMTVTGHFSMTCNAQNNVSPSVCTNLVLATTSSGLQELNITCQATSGAASPSSACSGNINLTNTFANTAFYCTGADSICRDTRFTMTAAASGSNTGNCPSQPNCDFVTQACLVGSCSCVGNCGSRIVDTKAPTRFPTTTAPTTNPTNHPTKTTLAPTSTPVTSTPTTPNPTSTPSTSPTGIPSSVPTTSPSATPTTTPSNSPSTLPSASPVTSSPSQHPIVPATQEITGGAFSNFGFSMAMTSDVIAIGGHNYSEKTGGAVHVLERFNTTWTSHGIIQPFDREVHANGRFGYSVDVSADGKTLVVGAWMTDSVYIYEKNAIVTKLSGTNSSRFGVTVGISGTTIVVGADMENSGAGTVLIYVKNPLSLGWDLQQKISAFDAANNDMFGRYLSIHGNTIAVGSYLDDTVNGVNSGSAYIYDRVGTNWKLTVKLIPLSLGANDMFGWPVLLREQYLFVGAQNHNANAGAVFAFKRQKFGWMETQKIVPTENVNKFGRCDQFAVDSSLSTLVLGASSAIPNSAFVFVRNKTMWYQVRHLKQSGGHFGWASAVECDSIFVGAPGFNKVFLFSQPGCGC